MVEQVSCTLAGLQAQTVPQFFFLYFTITCSRSRRRGVALGTESV